MGSKETSVMAAALWDWWELPSYPYAQVTGRKLTLWEPALQASGPLTKAALNPASMCHTSR